MRSSFGTGMKTSIQVAHEKAAGLAAVVEGAAPTTPAGRQRRTLGAVGIAAEAATPLLTAS